MTAIQEQSGKRQRLRIRFHERVQFKTIRHVSEFTDDEIRNGWYDKDDFNRMSENVSDIAQLISDGKTTLDGEALCTRGLEHIVEEELADYRAEKMINSIDAVLDEQEEQWDEGKEEPGLIAELYAEYAKPLLREAHLIGLRDAEQGYKSWDDLLEEKHYRKLGSKRAGTPCTKGMKTTNQRTKDCVSPSSFVNKAKVKKNRNKVAKHYIAVANKPEKEKKAKKDEDKTRTAPRKWNSVSSASDSSSSSFEVSSANSSQLSTPTSSSQILKRQSSISSINSCTLRDLSTHSTSEEIEAVVPSRKSTLDKQLPLTGIDEDANKPTSPKRQKKNAPRRTPMQRKHGTEASPFVYNRKGTLTFRKPDVEKMKREKREKRKTCIRGSLGKFLLDDDDEDDILAGILSGR